MFIKSQSY